MNFVELSIGSMTLVLCIFMLFYLVGLKRRKIRKTPSEPGGFDKSMEKEEKSQYLTIISIVLVLAFIISILYYLLTIMFTLYS